MERSRAGYFQIFHGNLLSWTPISRLVQASLCILCRAELLPTIAQLSVGCLAKTLVDGPVHHGYHCHQVAP